MINDIAKTDRKPSILQIVTDTDRRGAQIFAVQLGDELSRLGHVVSTVALCHGTVGGLDLPVLGLRRRSPHVWLALRRTSRSFDVVIAHGSTTLDMCATALPRNSPFIYRQISDSLFWARDPLRRVRVALCLKRARQVVALWDESALVLNTHFGVSSSKICVICNGVPESSFGSAIETVDEDQTASRSTGPGIRFIYVGSLVREKGVEVAMRAIATLDQCHFVVVGDGPDRHRLEELAIDLLPERHVFVGQVMDPRPYLRDSDVFVFPTLGGDSMPAAVIEASMCGLPVVASNDQGLKELVQDGVTGRLVAPGDVSALAEALRVYTVNPDLRRAHGGKARERAIKKYGMTAIAKQWADLATALYRDRNADPEPG